MSEAEHIKRMREASGNVNYRNHLITFIYILGRDHLSLGQIEEIMIQNNLNDSIYPEIEFTNGWLADWAEDVAKRLYK